MRSVVRIRSAVTGQLEFEMPLEFPATMKPHVPILIGMERQDRRSFSLQVGNGSCGTAVQ
jgi:hypothetical protein